LTGASIEVTDFQPQGAGDSVPEGWRVVRLGDIARISLGRTPARDRADYWSPPAVNWVSIGDLNGGQVSHTKEQISKKAHDEVFGGGLVPPGTLLLSFKLTIGKVGILSGPAVHNEAIASLELSDRAVDRDFLFYELQAFDYSRYVDTYVKGKTLNKDKLTKLPLPLPPLHEQSSIARALRQIDESVTAVGEVVSGARKLKIALRRKLFADLRADRAVEWRPLSELLREPLRNGHSAARDVNGSVRTLTLTAVTLNDFSDANTKLTAADPARVADLWLQPNDILIERANTKEMVGLAAMFEGDSGFAIYPDLMIRVRVDKARVISKFVAEFLLTDEARDYFRRNASGAAGNMPKISQGTIERLQIPLPSLEAQKRIAFSLSSVDRKLNAELRSRVELVALRDTLRAELLGGVRRFTTEHAP
jgi:restriction endonuclease S subunit